MKRESKGPSEASTLELKRPSGLLQRSARKDDAATPDRRGRKIVVGDVGDGRVEQAIPAIADLGKRLLAEVELVHNFEPDRRPRYDAEAMADDPAGHLKKLHRHAERRLELAAMRLREAGAPAVVTMTDKATAAEAILERAAESDAELIILVTDREESLGDRLLGTVVGQVVRDGSCPVLSITPDQAAAGARWRRVLSPIDFSERSREVLETGLRWADDAARADLLYVVEPGFPLFHGARGLSGDHFDAGSLEKRVWSEIDRFWGEIDGPDLAVRPHLAEGKVEEETVAAARRLKADILLVASDDGALGRSLGERLACRPRECPVLAVPG